MNVDHSIIRHERQNFTCKIEVFSTQLQELECPQLEFDKAGTGW